MDMPLSHPHSPGQRPKTLPMEQSHRGQGHIWGPGPGPEPTARRARLASHGDPDAKSQGPETARARGPVSWVGARAQISPCPPVAGSPARTSCCLGPTPEVIGPRAAQPEPSPCDSPPGSALTRPGPVETHGPGPRRRPPPGRSLWHQLDSGGQRGRPSRPPLVGVPVVGGAHLLTLPTPLRPVTLGPP